MTKLWSILKRPFYGISPRKLQKQHSSLANVLVALVLVAAICASLLVATPVSAINVVLSVPSSASPNSSLTMTAQVNIENGEALPITDIRLDITGTGTAYVVFNVAGGITSQSGGGGFTVTPTASPYSAAYGAGFGYAYGYGYDGATYGNWSGSWPGAGTYYGYGVGGGLTTQASYQIVFNTTGMAQGNYTAQMSVNTTPSPKKYMSTQYSFAIEVSGDGGAPPAPTTPAPTTPAPTTPAPTTPAPTTPAPTPAVTPISPVTQNVSASVNAQGVFTQNVSVGLTPPAGTQPIGSATLNINSGTSGLTGGGQPLSQITMQQLTSAPAPPAGDTIIGLPYDFKPDGATFSPPAELVFTGVPLDSVVMYWNGSAWIELETRIVGNTLVAEVPHFTTFAVFARAKPQPGSPAAFKVGSLKISPATANVNQAVNITVAVSNTGGTSGEYTVALKLNNKVEQEKKVTVSGGATKEAVFTVTGASAGNYSVDVNGLKGAFTVKAEAEPPAKGIPIVYWIIGTIVLVALVVGFILWRRRQYSN